MAALKAACNNNRLACLAMMSGAVLVILVAFWGAQQSALGAMDVRLRAAETRQATVIANQHNMMRQLSRIEKHITGTSPAIALKPQGD